MGALRPSGQNVLLNPHMAPKLLNPELAQKVFARFDSRGQCP
jgi:hypothetical protein